MTFPIIPASTVNGSYQISRSLRFRSSASAYLSRTPASAGNRKTWTWSGWVKRGALSNSATFTLFTANYNTAPWFALQFVTGTPTDQIQITFTAGSAAGTYTNAVFRDPSSWYHIVLAVDTTQSTASNRLKLYVNGLAQTFSSTNYPSLNTDYQVNNNVSHIIGGNSGEYFDGYLAEVNLIDGQALTPSSFGAFDTNGVWQPAKYTGSYGTNGFYLNFSDNSGATATTIGKDSSGNSNNWTPNNISVTSGTTYDSMIDSPTNYADGGNGRGNYAVLNPVSNIGNGTISNANLLFTGVNSTWKSSGGTIFTPSGKWYFECTLTNSSSSAMYGVINTNFPSSGFASYIGASAYGWCLQSSTGGTGKWNNGASAGIDSAVQAANDVYMVAFDVDAGKIWFGKNGTWYSSGDPASGTNAAYTNLSGSIAPAISSNSANDIIALNCGQRPFTYTPPSGFSALNTQNLPTPTIAAGNKYFDALTYTGNGSTQSVTGLNFQPDFVWIKSRSNAYSHILYDAVRGTGTTKSLYTESTNAEGAYSAYTNMTSFDSGGFSIGTTSGNNAMNQPSGTTYVSWNWKAGGSGVTNTSGSITSTVSANTSAGFSVVTYTGTGANATVGHGLGVTPALIFGHSRSRSAERWPVWNSVLTTDNYLELNSTAAVATGSTIFRTSAMSSTVIGIGGNASVNANTDTYVMYCFAPVSSFSAFGSFVGNGSSDGPMVFTNFRARYLLVKASSTTGDWVVIDTSRSPYNVSADALYANGSFAEDNNVTNRSVDFLSNGFKIRSSGTFINASGATFIYAAFAEVPFKTSRAR